MPSNVVIVGASAAGLTVAEALRRRGYDGRLTLVGDEPGLPYDRPPLSKQVLAGEWEAGRASLRGEEALAGLGADLLLGRAAAGLDTARRRVLLDGGATVGYDALVIATGVTPRSLPGADLAGVHVLRTMPDALSLRAELLGEPRVVVVGAGFLGAEVAATARVMGLDVTLADPLPVPMHRQLGPGIGGLVAEMHRDRGVAVRCGVGVSRFRRDSGRVTGVEMTDGSVLEADVVVVAVGAVPATGWLAGSGLPLGNGIECDDRCQAAPGIWAAGDVASWPHPRYGIRLRLEHRMNATEQAIAVAGNLLGDDKPFAPVPYFWSDQYDTKIQAHGVLPADADIEFISGSPAEGRFTAAYGRGGAVTGVLGWNAPPRELRALRELAVGSVPWAALTDPAMRDDRRLPSMTGAVPSERKAS
jgi:3-phenylpropionate/trans-cinnamate dioxygenase ferredoxin reductase component